MNQTGPNQSLKGKAKQTLDNHFNIGGTVQHPVISPFVQQITDKNFQIGGSNAAKKSVFDKGAVGRTMQRQISESSTQKHEEEKAQKLFKTLGEQKKVPETLVKIGNPLPQIPVPSTQQDGKNIDQEFRIAKQTTDAEGMDAEVTMELSQITHPKSQDQKRKTREALRRLNTKQPLFHRATELRKPTANPRCPMLKSRLSSQFIAPDGIDSTRKVTEVPKFRQHTYGKKIRRKTSQIHGLQSKPHKAENQSNYQQGTMRRMNKLPPIHEQHDSGGSTSSHLQISLAEEQVLIRRMSRFSMIRRHNDEVETNGGARKAVIQQKLARRPGVIQPMARWRKQQATIEEDAVHVSRYPRSRAMLTQRKLSRNYMEINQAKNNRSVAKVSIRPVNERCKVEIFKGRRVAIQQESNDYDYPGRRNGLCARTDPAQQELTFIRVLRKRF